MHLGNCYPGKEKSKKVKVKGKIVAHFGKLSVNSSRDSCLEKRNMGGDF